MHIEFSRLIINNFMSFGNVDIKFSNDGFIRVSGINENPQDNARSNGSGKSSLWEALVWVLTGETIRGTKQIVNQYGDDGAVVDIEFYIDNKRYQLIRSKDHSVRKTNLQILINGEDVSGKGIRDSEKLLQQYLPDLTASLLGSVIVLGQGLPQRFTNNTPSGRKEVLEQLSKSDFMIDDLKQRVAQRKQDLTDQRRSYEDTLLKCSTTQQQLTRRIQQSQDILDSIDAATLQRDKELFEQQLATLQETCFDCDEAITRLTEDQQQVNNDLMQLVTEESSELQELNKDTTVQNLKLQKGQLEAQKSTLSKHITAVKNIKDVCPTCGQKLQGVHIPDTSAEEDELTLINCQLTELAAQIVAEEQCFTAKTQEVKEKFAAQKTDLNNKNTSLSNDLRNKRREKEAAATQLTQARTKLNSVLVSLAQLQGTIASNKEIILKSTEELNEVEEQILYNNKQKDLTQSHLDVINKFDTALKRDFRGYLLSTVIEQIEARAKYYSNIIFDTDKVDFCLNGNNIDISYMSRAYENLSGGEKQKVDLIIQFSIRDMLSQQLGFTSNILVLDEVFDGLDALGCNKVIDMIASLSDVKNVFIVTHRKDLSIPSDKELIVVKSSVGISEIRG